MNTKITLLSLLVIPAFLLYAGCTHSWVPSDTEAENMVKSHFLFAHEGKEVDADVLAREEFNNSCQCYPITFKIKYSPQRDNHKTFYFYKDRTGKTALREYFRVATL